MGVLRVLMFLILCQLSFFVSKLHAQDTKKAFLQVDIRNHSHMLDTTHSIMDTDKYRYLHGALFNKDYLPVYSCFLNKTGTILYLAYQVGWQMFDSIELNPPLPDGGYHVFGDTKDSMVYMTHAPSKGSGHEATNRLYVVNLRNGAVHHKQLKTNFPIDSVLNDSFGRSLIDQYRKNDTFYLSFGYEYSHPWFFRGGDGMDSLLWSANHLGMAIERGDSLYFEKAFGKIVPELFENIKWQHPNISYAEDEILMSIHCEEFFRVYDYAGDFVRDIKTPVEGFGQEKLTDKGYRASCRGRSPYHEWLIDSVVTFWRAGWVPQLNAYYRSVSYPQSHGKGQGGFLFVERDGSPIMELYGFESNIFKLGTASIYALGYSLLYDKEEERGNIKKQNTYINLSFDSILDLMKYEP